MGRVHPFDLPVAYLNAGLTVKPTEFCLESSGATRSKGPQRKVKHTGQTQDSQSLVLIQLGNSSFRKEHRMTNSKVNRKVNICLEREHKSQTLHI